MYNWSRFGGYEVSTKGDRRFSALNAVMNDGRTLEMHYQCDTKGYQPGGTNWRLGKGKPPLNPETNTLEAYIDLWRIWAHHNLPLMRELYRALQKAGTNTLSDRFATTPVNQAHALAVVLTELVNGG